MVSRYDLNSQNLKRKYAVTGKNNGVVSDTVSDPGQLAEFLQDIGQLDKQYLESQLRDNKSHILKILCNTIKKKIINSDKSEDSYDNEMEFQLKHQTKTMQSNTQFNTHHTHSNRHQDTNNDYKPEKSDRNMNSSNSKTGKENKAIEYRNHHNPHPGPHKIHNNNSEQEEAAQISPKSHQNLYELVEENNPDIHNYHHSPQRYQHTKKNHKEDDTSKNEHIASQKSLKKIKDQQVYTEGNYHPAIHTSVNGGYGHYHSSGIVDKPDYTEEPNSSKGRMKVLTNLQLNPNVKNYQSPRKKTSATAHSKENQHLNNKRATQVSSRVKAHYYSKNVISPHRTHTQQSNSKNNNLSKKSNLTIFTNNTLTSTLSPKSNLSLSTFKSSSRGNTCKGSQKSAKKS